MTRMTRRDHPPLGAPSWPVGVMADHTAAFANLKLSNLPMNPDIDTCLAHLKLLAAFHAMKEEVGYTDGLWGLWNTRADISDLVPENGPFADSKPRFREVALARPATRTAYEKIAVLSKLREKRWAVFVSRSVKRYEAWWKSMLTPSLKEADMGVRGDASSYGEFPWIGDGLVWTPAMLPPLGKAQTDR